VRFGALALSLLFALGACASPPPPPSRVAVDNEPTSLTTPVCLDGVVRDSGVGLSGKTFGFAIDVTGERALAITTGACNLDVAIRACHERDPLGGGSVQLELTIGTDGTVTHVERMNGAEGALATCVEEAFAKSIFPRGAAGTSRYRVVYPVRVVSILETETIVVGVAPALVKPTLRATRPQLRTCYESLLKKKERIISGSLSIDMVVRANGSVKSVELRPSDTLQDDEFSRCAGMNAFGILRFPPLPAEARIHYVLTLRTSVRT